MISIGILVIAIILTILTFVVLCGSIIHLFIAYDKEDVLQGLGELLMSILAVIGTVYVWCVL